MQLTPQFAVIPVIEVSAGRAPSPTPWESEGEPTNATATPSEVAQYWIDQGASRLQVVDLDSLARRSQVDESVIARLVSTVGSRAEIDLVAGVRDRASLDRAAATGAHRVVVDVAATPGGDFLARAVAELADRASVRVLISPAGRLAAPGTGFEGLDIPTALVRLNDVGVPHYLVCEAEQRGHWWSRHHSSLEGFCRQAARPVTAGSGVTSLEGLHQLLALVSLGLDGAVVGQPLAGGRFSFAEAQTAAEARFDPYEWGPAQP